MTALAEERRRVGGVTLRYLIGGNGPSLVLCHGFMGSAENFGEWFSSLAERRTLIIPDLPGNGESEALEGCHTVPALANAVRLLVDDLGVQDFDLGGLCLGAAVACSLVRSSPSRIGRVFLHTPLLGPRLVKRRFRVQARALTAPGIFPAAHWLSHRRVVSDLYKRWFVEGNDVDSAAAEMNFLNQTRADPRAIRESLRDGIGRSDVEVVIHRARPTLLLVPADDRIADVGALRRRFTGVEGVTLAVIEDSGHGWNADSVRRQLDVITAFLDGDPLPGEPAHPGSRAGAAVAERRSPG